MIKNKNAVYIKVSKDEYELIEAIADDAHELAYICGVTPNLIFSCISHAKKSGNKSQFRKVVLDE